MLYAVRSAARGRREWQSLAGACPPSVSLDSKSNQQFFLLNSTNDISYAQLRLPNQAAASSAKLQDRAESLRAERESGTVACACATAKARMRRDVLLARVLWRSTDERLCGCARLNSLLPVDHAIIDVSIGPSRSASIARCRSVRPAKIAHGAPGCV